MGNLHAGHGSLVHRAVELADRVVVSVFVNPLQFGPNEDFAAYPRTPDEDRQLLEALDADMLFTPEVEEMYPRGQEDTARVQVPHLDSILCGAFRPGHFTGVATIVTKLLNLVQPDVALFGEKDYQQLMIIRRAATDLCMPMEIVGVATTREPDGLAMSSRNAYLSREEREKALSLSRGLADARNAWAKGERDVRALRLLASKPVEAAATSVDYVTVADPETLQPLPDDARVERRALVAIAARIGKTRLIDNTYLGE